MIFITNPTHTSVSFRTQMNVQVSHAVMCDDCGATRFRPIDGDVMCVNCGLADPTAMVVDRSSELPHPYSDTGCDHHRAVSSITNTPGHGLYVPHVSIARTATAEDKDYKKTRNNESEARKTVNALGITMADEVNTFSKEASQMYAAAGALVYPSKYLISACTIVVMKKTRDINTVVEVLCLRPRDLGKAIEALFGLCQHDQGFNVRYGGYFQKSAPISSKELSDSAIAHLRDSVSMTPEEIARFEAGAWGLNTLVTEMTGCVNAAKCGLGNITTMARVLVLEACRLHAILMRAPAAYLADGRYVTLQSHGKYKRMWTECLGSAWVGGADAFDERVAKTLSMVEYGTARSACSRKRTRSEADEDGDVDDSATDRRKRMEHTRRLRAEVMAVLSKAPAITIALRSGIAHLCVTVAECSPAVDVLVRETGAGALVRVCHDACVRSDACEGEYGCEEHGAVANMARAVETIAGFSEMVRNAKSCRSMISLNDVTWLMPKMLQQWST